MAGPDRAFHQSPDQCLTDTLNHTKGWNQILNTECGAHIADRIDALTAICSHTPLWPDSGPYLRRYCSQTNPAVSPWPAATCPLPARCAGKPHGGPALSGCWFVQLFRILLRSSRLLPQLFHANGHTQWSQKADRRDGHAYVRSDTRTLLQRSFTYTL